MLTLLKQLVVPQLEYASVICSPTDQRSINRLESVQRMFTSKFSCFLTYDEVQQRPICTIDYQERIRSLKIYSLKRRRERYIIIYTYKIIIGLVNNPGINITYSAWTKIHVKSKMSLATSPAWAKRVRASSFFVQDPRLYNSISPTSKRIGEYSNPSKTDSDNFKARLDKYLQTLPDIPGTSRNSISIL